MIQNKISEALATIGAEMEYALGPDGERKVRDLAGEYMVRNMGNTFDREAQYDYTMGHLYELNKRGQPRYRLFKVVRREGQVFVSLKPAKMLVPLSDSQKEEGPTGRRVTKRYRFPARPWVYEYGKKVVIRRKTSRYMWTIKTNVTGDKFFPPLRGPVSYVPRPEYRFKLREKSRLYLKTDGRMHMNAAASRYARESKRSLVAAVRSKSV